MFNYRKAVLEDLQIVQELSVELCEWESKSFDKKYNSFNALTEEGTEIIMNAIKSELYLVLLVEDKNEAIGFMLCGISKPAFYWSFEKLSELHKLYVKDEYRGKGIGEELMNKFIDFSKKNNVDRMEIYTFFDSDANDFYERFGFKKKALFLRKDLK